MKPCPLPDSKLLIRVIELLNTRPRNITLKDIEVQTGVPERWMLEILSNPQSNPGVRRIECLFEYLSGKQLGI